MSNQEKTDKSEKKTANASAREKEKMRKAEIEENTRIFAKKQRQERQKMERENRPAKSGKPAEKIEVVKKGVSAVAWVLDKVATESFVTNSEVKKGTGMSEQSVSRLLGRMMKAKLIRRSTVKSEKNMPLHRWSAGKHQVFR